MTIRVPIPTFPLAETCKGVKNKLRISLAAIGAFGLVLHAATDVHSEPYSGRESAQKICGECHAVLPEDKKSPNAAATSFEKIANNPFWTRSALIVWFQTPHPTMPNLILDDEELENVIAYILSLKDKS